MSESEPNRHVRARLLDPEVIFTTHDEVQATYTVEQAQAEVRRVIEAGFDLEAAKHGCPFEVDIPAYFQKILEGDLDGALRVIYQSHPFPSIFGRMCHMFCQQATPPLQNDGTVWPEWIPPVRSVAPEYGDEAGWQRRFGPGGHGPRGGRPADTSRPAGPPGFSWGAVSGSIRGSGHGSGIPGGGGVERPAYLLLERFVGDYGDPSKAAPQPERPPSGKRVAVIGAGSGGLANAWMLRRLGHEVDVFDQLPVPGGTLFAGYPAHRMAKFGVRRENNPTAWGARFVGSHQLSKAEIERIIEAYDLTYLSTGEFEPRTVGIPGEDAHGVWNALFFIAEVSYGRRPIENGRVVILGAGHTASDTAQVARRLGCQIKIFYRRGLDEMPIDDEDPHEYVSRMTDDGIEYHFLAQPVRIIADKRNRVTGIEFVRTQLGEPDGSGRRSPQAIPGSNFIEPCDAVIEAVGEAVDLALIPNSIERNATHVVVDRADHRTTHPKVFAGGDIIGDRGNDGATLAGIQAARTMDALLRGEPPIRFDSQPLR